MTPDAPAPRVFPWRPLAAAGLLVLLLVLQYLLFRRYAVREIVWAYPDQFDQAGYLGLTYQEYEDIRAHGLWAGLWHGLSTIHPTGVLFPVEGSLFLLLLGPSRLSALTMHFAHFALFQEVLFWTLYWRTRRWSFAFLGLGLLLAAAAPYAPGGGMFDYRIDFSAFCLFGVTLCLVVRSRLFASWGWAGLAGAAGSWTVLCRSLTAVYLAGVFGLFFLFLAAHWWRAGREGGTRRLVARQLGGLLLGGTAVVGLAGPILGHNFAAVYTYYVGSHLSSAELQFRSAGLGLGTALASLTYYLGPLGQEQLGPVFVVLAALVLAAAGVLRLVACGTGPGDDRSGAVAPRGLWFFVLACLLVPLAVLTLDPAKVPQVAGIFLPSLLWVLVLSAAALCRARAVRDSWALTAGLSVLAAGVLVAGTATQVVRSRRPGVFAARACSLRQVGELYDVLARHCQERGWTAPRVAATCLQTDYFQPIVILPYVYERHHVLIAPQPGRMNGYLWPVTEAEACDELRHSDFVVLVDPAQAPSLYPFDQSIRPLFPKLKAFCDDNLTPLCRSRIWHFDVVLYTRPTGVEHPGATRVAASSDMTGEVCP
jgi:hypothetical protein